LIKDEVKLIDALGCLFNKAQPEKSARMNKGRYRRLKTPRERRQPPGEQAKEASG
jgi:hypothetical protein